MSVLTKHERDGLDEVFLSIHANQDKLQRIKELSSLILSRKNNFSMTKLLKVAKYGIKESKISHFFSFNGSKKKNLSK